MYRIIILYGMADHYSLSVDQLDGAKVTRSRLAAELGRPDRNPQEVGRLANQVRAQVKLAEVHALLAISQRLDDVRLPS